MAERIQTSTPILSERFILPPPRKLWAADSPTEQLYHNKWKKYRNSIVDDNKKSWGNIDAPNFVDFQNIPENRDVDFDNANEEDFMTPQRFAPQQWPDDFDEENNNLLMELKKCTVSAIKKIEGNRRNEEEDLNRFIELADPIPIIFRSSVKSNMITEKSDKDGKNVVVEPNPINFGSLEKSILKNIEKIDEKMITETAEPPDRPELKNNAEKPSAIKSKIDKKNCTTVEPFSFEIREKWMQEHKIARRERDSIDKETWKGFRANPRPNFLNARAKIIPTVKTRSETKETKNSISRRKIQNAGEIWKKKAFQPVYPKRTPVVPKAPELLTAVRAKNRQRFEEDLKEKEQQRLAFQKIEEAARKKREEEEIAKLRRELVHKAQPIRKYKMIVPKVEKRPLTEPTSPIKCKRRRKN